MISGPAVIKRGLWGETGSLRPWEIQALLTLPSAKWGQVSASGLVANVRCDPVGKPRDSRWSRGSRDTLTLVCFQLHDPDLFPGQAFVALKLTTISIKAVKLRGARLGGYPQLLGKWKGREQRRGQAMLPAT